MDERHPSRREFLGASLLAVPGLSQAGTSAQRPPEKPLSIICVGGHPDDPESGCGGTLARYAAAGHRVTIIYLTRGERGIAGKSLDEAARIRTAEAEKACGMLGTVAKFAGQIDGATEVTPAAIERLVSLVRAEAPDVAFTHWPIDSHPDHQAASVLTMRAWYALNQAFSLYFFEVDAGVQTIGFRPSTYVDVTAVRETKKRALFAHEASTATRSTATTTSRWRRSEAGRSVSTPPKRSLRSIGAVTRLSLDRTAATAMRSEACVRLAPAAP